jgi:cell division septum initiation protein DivIVA
MITKISSNEYLRRVDNMSVAERESYLSRVGEWMEKQAPLLLARANDSVARFQNAIQCSAMWNDDECRAWEDGARLLTAMAGKTDTWLPEMLYVKAAKRSIGQMVNTLNIEHGTLNIKAGAQAKPLSENSERMQAAKTKEAGYDAPFRGVGQGNNDGEGKKEDVRGKMDDGILNPEPLTVNQGMVPVRPKHIDQYVHLLPEKTQQKAATVQGLLRDLDKARENARLLMNDPKAKSDSIAQWAKTATALDAKVKAVYKELDAEWEKLVSSGRVTLDAFGNATVVEMTNEKGEMRNDADDDSKSTRQAKPEAAKRIEYLKKWLRDTRTKASDERKKQWTKNCKELLKLGGELTDSIRKAGEHYGVDVKTLNMEH